MFFDPERHLGAVTRTVTTGDRDGRPTRTVTMKRSYETTAEDLWDALTSTERLPRWFLPVEGDLRLGGHYQLKGNARGTITECEPHARLGLTWDFGGDTSWVDALVAPDPGGGACLTLHHTAHPGDHWVRYGPGAVGIGWDLGLLGLALHVGDPDARFDEGEIAGSPEGVSFMLQCSDAWADADIASGENPEQARNSAARTAAFYTAAAAGD